MWDTKRQLIWFAAGFIFCSFILYQDAFDEETARFSLSFFIFLELLLLLIMSGLFYLYKRKNKN